MPSVPRGRFTRLLLTAGVLGACLVFAIAWLIPQVGAGPVMITLLAGQVVGGLVMSHFGWLGSPVQPVTLTKIAGVAVMIGGVVLATYREVSTTHAQIPGQAPRTSKSAPSVSARI